MSEKLSQNQQLRVIAFREAVMLARNGDNVMEIITDAERIERFLSGEEVAQ